MAKRTDLAYRLPADLCDAVGVVASEHGRSKTSMIEWIVRDWLASLGNAKAEAEARKIEQELAARDALAAPIRPQTLAPPVSRDDPARSDLGKRATIKAGSDQV